VVGGARRGSLVLVDGGVTLIVAQWVGPAAWRIMLLAAANGNGCVVMDERGGRKNVGYRVCVAVIYTGTWGCTSARVKAAARGDVIPSTLCC